jgi:hypothetical protein
MHRILQQKYIVYLFVLIIAYACKPDKDGETEQSNVSKEEIDTSAVLLKYNETLFTVPSPYQATRQLEKNDIALNKNLLNSIDNYKKYNTSFKQALNIGIYGTDLGYLNVYGQSTDCISYFTAIKKLSEDLGIKGAIDAVKLKKIEKNLQSQDSLLYYMSSTYRLIDSYLKKNDRKEIGALIIAGGWIESVYILSQAVLESNNRDLINRLGEQKHPLNNLIELLSSYYYDSDKYTNLIDSLVDLAYEYDGIMYNYYYKEPEIYPEKKLTVIRSNSNVVISKYHIQSIANKIEKIRNKIIQ